MKRGHIRAVAVITVFVGLSILLASPAMAQKKEPITVGVIHSLSGPGGVFGQWYRDGSLLAREEINASGGILGRQLKLIFRDDKGSPETGLREAKDLVMREKVNYLSGTVVSSVALAISQFCREQKKLFIIDNAGDASITEENGHRYVFRATPAARGLAYAPAYYVKDMPYTKYWIMGPDYAYGHSMADMFLEKLKELKPGVQVVGESWPKFGTTDFTPYISAIMAAKPDALFSSVWGADWVAWLKQAKPMGFHDKIVEIGGEKAQIENLLPGGKDVPEGLIAAGPFVWWDPVTQTNESKAFVKKVFDRTGNPYPSTAVLTGYLAMHSLARAITNAKTADTEKVIDALVGIEIDWMCGPNGKPYKSKIRGLDHMFGCPMTVGVVKNVPEYPFPVTVNSKMYTGDQILPSEAQIRKARGIK